MKHYFLLGAMFVLKTIGILVVTTVWVGFLAIVAGVIAKIWGL